MQQKMNRRSWHRRASRPVSLWLCALILLVFIHPFIPQARWLMVHMVTLGLVTTSIMVWGQHFTEALLKTRLGEETRPTQVRRIWLLNASIVVVMLGMLADWPWVSVLGALGVSAAILWYAASLGAQIKAALAPRFAFVVRAYLIAATLLPVGAVLGSILAFSPGEPWQGRLLLGHQIVNVLGFVGVTASATLLTLWPTVVRTKIDGAKAPRAYRSLILLVIGVCIALLGSLVNNLLIGVAGIVVYAAGLLSILAILVGLGISAARHPRREPIPLFPALSLAAGVLWFVGSVLALAIMWVSAAGGPGGAAADSPLNFSLLASDVQKLTVPFVAGFLVQLLFGAMSFLMPSAMGGGPRALKASLAEMSRFAVVRVVAYNLALALFAFAGVPGTPGDALFGLVTFGTFSPEQFGSITRVLVSLLAFAALATFVVLMIRLVKVNVRERIEFQKRANLGMPSTGAPAGPGTPLAAGPAGTSAAATKAKEEQPGADVGRRHLTGALVGMGSVLGIAAVGRALDGTLGGTSSAPAGGDAETASTTAVTPTGKTTKVQVKANEHMRFVPDTISVPAGNTLEIEVTNTDPANVHDLVLETGESTARIEPGASEVLKAGPIGGPVEGWCSIVGHKSMGMLLHITATGAEGSAHAHHGHAAESGAANPLARVAGDLAAEPGPSHDTRDPNLPAVPSGPQDLTFEVTELPIEIAPGVAMEAMTYNGSIMGPTIVSPIGGRVNLTLVNHGTMGHSIDFHAGTVSPTTYMRTIGVGETLNYPFTTDYAGIWLYHCSTAPMTVHLSSGMYGALVVPPQDAGGVDREYYLVQSDHYLAPEASTTADGSAATGPDGTAVHAVSSDKIFAEQPDFTVFNGHANQYLHAPLKARVGERVRIWVLAAGPSVGLSFHVVGTIFDTVFKEGAFVLRPDNESGGGAQALDLGAAQGGFVEMVFHEAGTYKAVNHSFAHLERGALALIEVTD